MSACNPQMGLGIFFLKGKYGLLETLQVQPAWFIALYLGSENIQSVNLRIVALAI